MSRKRSKSAPDPLPAEAVCEAGTGWDAGMGGPRGGLMGSGSWFWTCRFVEVFQRGTPKIPKNGMLNHVHRDP